jgi:hypothetical protein
MGFLDKVKDATGIGLTADDQYRRAYEKGVFLQPPDYSAASKHFSVAAEKFRKEGNTAWADRAEANALMYRLVETRDFSLLPALQKSLERIGEIERPASQEETVATLALIDELRALQSERRADAATDLAAKVSEYRNAGVLVTRLGTMPLTFADRLNLKGPTDKALMRGAYYNALADYHSAFDTIAASPEKAQDSLHRAAVGFRHAQQTDLVDMVESHIDDVQTKRHCWTCGREMQGRNYHFRYYPATAAEYHRRVVEARKEDSGMLDRAGSVTLCAVCGSAIERQADEYASRRAGEVQAWAREVFASHAAEITALQSRVASLEGFARRVT